MITYGQGIGLITTEIMPHCTAYQFACNLKRIISLYSSTGCTIQTILIDMELNKVTPEIPEVAVNTSAALEYVAKVERRIRVVKERCRACMEVLHLKGFQMY